MSTQGISDPPRRRARRAAALILAAILITAAVALVPLFRRDDRDDSPAHRSLPAEKLASLRAAADGGDDAALASLVDALHNRTPADARPLAAEMLRSTRAEVRAATCGWIGRRRDAALAAAMLVPRLSDQDWRVRAAAFDALRSVAGHAPGAPRGPSPLRDTPVDERERLIFAWIDGWRASGDDARPPLPTLAESCELYAASGGHWLTGQRLAESCLACHAPPDRFATGDFAQCATCHGDAHREWAASSHARSTTHLNLARVNPQTKQVERYDVGPREGLVCTTCHGPAAAADVVPLPAGTENLIVPHRFRRGAAAASCATCHAETQAEWEAWTNGPRPKGSRWLPGDVTWDQDASSAVGCITCHMPQRPAPGAGLNHALAARRDPALMSGGLVASLEPPTAARGAQLVLTNLAGHRYPSGTVRRALRIELRYDTDGDDAPMRLLTRLTDSTVPTTQPTQPALAPAEQRRIDVPPVQGAQRVICRITYERNQFEPGTYELVLRTLSERVDAPP